MTEELKTAKNSSAWGLHADHVHPYAYWENAFTPEECDSIIAYGKSFSMFNGVIGKPNGEYSVDTEIRDSKIVFIQPGDETSWIYRKLTDVVVSLNDQFFKFDLHGFNEGLQFTEYVAPCGKYDLHIDRAHNSVIRKLSIVVQLSDPENYEGGDFVIKMSSSDTPLNKNRGTLLAFPSYQLHGVTPITKGTRYSLVGWITGKPFK